MSTNNVSGLQTYANQEYYKQQNRSFSANNEQLPTKIIENNSLVKTAGKAKENSSNSALMGLGITGGLVGVSSMINNSLRGEYSESLFGKLEYQLHRLGNWVKTNNTAADLITKTRSGKNTAITAIKNQIDKSELLTTFFKKPSLGGNMIQGQAQGTLGHISSKALEVLGKIVQEQATNPAVALDPAKISEIEALIAKSKDAYSGKYVNEIINLIKTLPDGVKNHVFSERSWMSLKLLKDKSSLTEILNKYTLIEKYKNGGQGIASKITGYIFRGTESLTNGMLSSIGAVLMQGMFIAMSFNEARKAEKGEKFQTFAASLADLMALTTTNALQARLMNHAAGLQYIGMSKANYAKIHPLIEEINLLSKDATKAAEYATKLAELKALKNVDLRWYQKPIKWLGQLLSIGRVKETIKPMSTGTIGGMLNKIPYGLKYLLGGAGRIALIFFVILPMFQKIGRGLSHLIFGKPVKTIERDKQKELEEKQKAAEQAQKAQAEQAAATVQQAAPNVQQTPAAPSKPGNLIDTMNKMKDPNYQQTMGQTQNYPQQPYYPQMQQYPQGYQVQQQGYPMPQGYPQIQYPQQMQQQGYPMPQGYPQIQYQPQMQQQAPIASQPVAQPPIANTPVSPESQIKRTYIPNPILGPEAAINPASSRSAEIDRVMKQADWAEEQAHKLGV